MLHNDLYDLQGDRRSGEVDDCGDPSSRRPWCCDLLSCDSSLEVGSFECRRNSWRHEVTDYGFEEQTVLR